MVAPQANNYKITDAADTIVFEGTQAPVFGRAAFLTFCVFICVGALALVLTILEAQVFGEGGGLGNIWYLSTLASPVAGKYYLDNAERSEQISVKIVTEDDEMTSEVVVQGDEEEVKSMRTCSLRCLRMELYACHGPHEAAPTLWQVDRFQKTLDLREKGMIYVKGILES